MDGVSRQTATTNLVEYEARLNHVLSKYDVICNYIPSQVWRQLRQMDIMRTHPLVINRGLLREEPVLRSSRAIP